MYNYDFGDFLEIFHNMIHSENKISSLQLNNLKKELNKFFKDSTCREIVYTENTDKLFFGMRVMPVIQDDEVGEIIEDTRRLRIRAYYLEIDSKLLSPTLGLDAREVLATLLHEVGHIVNTSQPVDKVRQAIDLYLAENKESLILSSSVHYREILAFGIKDTIIKICSIFEKNKNELLADEFVVDCGFGEDLESAFDKMVKKGFIINNGIENKFVVLSWVFRLYKDMKLMRIPALKKLRKSKDLNPSKLDKREIQNIINRINRIDDDTFNEASLKDKYSENIRRMKYNNVKQFKQEYHEYAIRVRNTEEEEDALYLLRAINLRIAVIEDIISNESMSENKQKVKECLDLVDKYSDLREYLTTKTIYKNRRDAIIVQYPDIVPNRRLSND